MQYLHGLLWWLTTVVVAAVALRVDDAAFRDIPQVRELAGVHSVSEEMRTPPSVRTTRWQFLLLENESDTTQIGGECPEGSFACGVTSVVLDNDKEKTIVTEIIALAEKDTVVSHSATGEIWTVNSNGKWGDEDVTLELSMNCQREGEDNIEWTQHTLTKKNSIKWSSSKFCPGPGKPPQDGMGWFTFFFIVCLAFFGAYLVLQAWYNTSSMGSASDFLNELFDVVVENLSRLPSFIGEVLSRITGGQSRGGYSAV